MSFKKNITFKESCIYDKHSLMQMSELKSVMLAGHSCYGCMLDNTNHFCISKNIKHMLNIRQE